MIPNLDSPVLKFLGECLEWKHYWLVLFQTICIICVNYIEWSIVLAMVWPKTRDYWVVFNAIMKMYIEIAGGKMFDKFFYIVSGYCAMIALLGWILLFTVCRKTALFLLRFQNNLVAYRKCLQIDKMKAYMKENCSILSKLSIDISLPIGQVYRFLSGKPIFVDVQAFQKIPREMQLFSHPTLIKLAIIQDVMKLILNTVILMVISGSATSTFIFVRNGVVNPIGLFLINWFLVNFFFLIFQFYFVGFTFYAFVVMFHMYEQNRKFRFLYHYDKVSSLKRFILVHVLTSNLLEAIDCSMFLFLWFYSLIPIHAFLLFRLTHTHRPAMFKFATTMFFSFNSGFMIASFLVPCMVYTSFYVYCSAMPGIIYQLKSSGHIGFLFKWKTCLFHEQQTSRRMESGFKIAPVMIVKTYTFMTVSNLLSQLLI